MPVPELHDGGLGGDGGYAPDAVGGCMGRRPLLGPTTSLEEPLLGAAEKQEQHGQSSNAYDDMAATENTKKCGNINHAQDKNFLSL